MNSRKHCLVIAACLLSVAGVGRAQERIPVGPYFDYYPNQYVVIDNETGVAWPAGEALDPPASEKSLTSETYNWVTKNGIRAHQATKYAAGYSGWRLPSTSDLLIARDHGLYEALVEVANLEGREFPRAFPIESRFGSWSLEKVANRSGPWVNILAPSGFEVEWWPSNGPSNMYLPVRDTTPPTTILWRDSIQTGQRPWGFSGLATEYNGAMVAPNDANGANISRVADPAGGPDYAMRHFAVFGNGGARSQAGLWSFANPAFAGQALSDEGVYVAQEWYFPAALNAGGHWAPWINVWDWHSMGPSGANRWHTSPGMFLARDGTMRFNLGWHSGLSGNPTSAWSTIPFPVGRWFDIEMYYKWTTGPATLKVWIDGELALEQTVPRTRLGVHNVVETYSKFYGGAPTGTAWSPTPSVRYTRNVRVAGKRIWQDQDD